MALFGSQDYSVCTIRHRLKIHHVTDWHTITPAQSRHMENCGEPRYGVQLPEQQVPTVLPST